MAVILDTFSSYFSPEQKIITQKYWENNLKFELLHLNNWETYQEENLLSIKNFSNKIEGGTNMEDYKHIEKV